jgi:cytochrome b
MSYRTYVWDPLVRLFHWSLAACFVADAFFTNPEKNLHHYIGYAVAGLVIIRVLWGFVGSKYARFKSFPPSPAKSFGQVREIMTGERHVHAGHSPLGALMIYNLLLTFSAIALSGYLMTTVTYFGVEWVEELHEALVTWVEISIAAHILAVVLESWRLKINLPMSMVTGQKDLS